MCIRDRREINYSIYSKEEFQTQKEKRNPFILDVIEGKKLFLIVNENELWFLLLPVSKDEAKNALRTAEEFVNRTIEWVKMDSPQLRLDIDWK